MPNNENAPSIPHAVEQWLHTEVAAAYDELKTDPSIILTADELRASLLADAETGDPHLEGPPSTPDSEAVRDLRAELARGWLDSATLATHLHSQAKNKSQLASRYRKQGRLLGVWDRPRKRYLYPPWQIKNGQPLHQVKDLLALIRGAHGIAGDWDTSGWEEAGWFYAPLRLLEGKRPADLMASDADRVLDAARREFQDGPDARW